MAQLILDKIPLCFHSLHCRYCDRLPLFLMLFDVHLLGKSHTGKNLNGYHVFILPKLLKLSVQFSFLGIIDISVVFSAIVPILTKKHRLPAFTTTGPLETSGGGVGHPLITGLGVQSTAPPVHMSMGKTQLIAPDGQVSNLHVSHCYSWMYVCGWANERKTVEHFGYKHYINTAIYHFYWCDGFVNMCVSFLGLTAN